MIARLIFIVCLVASIAVTATIASAQDSLIIPGRIVGGTYYTKEIGAPQQKIQILSLACEDGYLLRGVAFRASDWLTNVRVLCTPYVQAIDGLFPRRADDINQYFDSFEHGPIAGSPTGGNLFGATMCGDRAFVAAFDGWVAHKTGSGVYVGTIGLICINDTLTGPMGKGAVVYEEPPIPNVVPIYTDLRSGTSYKLADRSIVYTQESSATHGCMSSAGPAGRYFVAKGIYVRYSDLNNDIISFGLICTEVVPYAPADRTEVIPKMTTSHVCAICYAVDAQREWSCRASGLVGEACSCKITDPPNSMPRTIKGTLCNPL